MSGLRVSLTVALIVGVPVIAGLALYYRYLGLWFWTDDFLWLEAGKNPSVLDALKEAFAFPRGATPYWRPLVDLYFFAMYRVFGLNAGAYHVANLVLHLIAGATLGRLVWRLTRSVFAGGVASALFTVAPTYSAMVSWVSGVTAILSSVFALLALLTMVKGLQEERPHRWLAIAALCYLGAMLSKEDAVALLPVLLLIGLYARPARGRQDLRELARLSAPFAGLALVYLALQLSLVVGADKTRGYEFGWHVFPRLAEALRWISLPWPTWFASWVDPAQWAAFLVLIAAAVLAALRRRWLAPILYLSTVLLLLPSSFLTTEFAPRWTYLATATWAAFLAVLLLDVYRLMSGWARPVSGVVGAAVVVAALVLLAQHTIDGQSWVPGIADEYESIQAVSARACPDTTNEHRIFSLALPVVDPGYAVPSLLRLYDQGRIYPINARRFPGAPPPAPGDCVLWWEAAGYQAREVTPSWQGFDVWAPPSSANLVSPIEGWQAVDGEMAAGVDGVLMSSEGALHGAVSPDAVLAGRMAYVMSIWVRGAAFAQGDRAIVALRQRPSGTVLGKAVEVPLTGEWQRVSLYYAVGAQPVTVSLGVGHLSGEGLSSFLARDAQLKVIGIPPP